MSTKKRSTSAELFSFKMTLLPNGNVDLSMQSVNPEDFQKVMDKGMPSYEGSHSIGCMIRYFKKACGEIMEKSRNYL
tara:strand:+ start:368 stop:598 length:231 start_codon:yes stop_codon:yes gene_type:complete